MESYLYHLQLNIDFSQNKDFYKGLMDILGWNVIFETEDMIGYKSGKNGDLWFVDSDSKVIQNHDDRGVNHLAIRVGSQSSVDECTKYLEEAGVIPLFETPKHREDFAASESETYYQVMFESEDKILFEIVYVGAKD